MGVDGFVAEFRSVVRRLGPRSHGTRYPAPLRQKAAEYLRERRVAGVPVSVIAGELDVCGGTLLRWAQEPQVSTGPAFVPVKVMAAPGGGGVVVHAPSGLRIEGLDVVALADLLRRLG